MADDILLMSVLFINNINNVQSIYTKEKNDIKISRINKVTIKTKIC